MFLKKLILVSATALILSACSSSDYTLTTQGANVNFSDDKPGANCQLLGQAEGIRGTFFSGTKTHSEMMREAAIDLLNKAGAMGGNVVYNAQDATMRIVSELMPSDIKMTGDVYKCQ